MKDELKKYRVDVKNKGFDITDWSDNVFGRTDSVKEWFYKRGFVEHDKQFLPTTPVYKGPTSNWMQALVPDSSRSIIYNANSNPAWADRVFFKGDMDVVLYDSVPEVFDSVPDLNAMTHQPVVASVALPVYL